MNEVTSHRKLALDGCLMLAVWLLSRYYFYSHYWSAMQDIMRGMDSQVMHMWYLPAPMLTEQLTHSMWLLRGEPPLPQLLIGLLMKVQTWPFTVPVDSFLMSLMSLFTAFIIYAIVRRLQFQRPLAIAAAALWLLNPSILAAEIEAFPICFYELLPAFFFTLSLWLLLRAHDLPQQRRWLYLFGLTLLLTAMSRSTLSFLFILPFLIALLLPPGKAKWVAAAFTVVFQLGWSLKNYAVYQEFQLETTADVGQNLFSTLLNTDNMGNFYEFHQHRHPENRFVHGLVKCMSQQKNLGNCADDPLINEWFGQERDKQLKASTNIGDALYGESYGHSAFTQAIKPLFVEYLLHRPDRAVDMFFKSYQLFWGDTVDQITYIEPLKHDTMLKRLQQPFLYIKFVQIIAIHCFGIALFVLYFTVHGKHARPAPAVFLGFIFCALAFSYLAVFSSLGDHGENPRYRLAVEPLIWLLPWFIWRGWQLLLGASEKIPITVEASKV